MAADAKVRIDLVGGGRILRALRGLRRTVASTNAETRTDSRRTRNAVEGDQRAEAQAVTRNAQAQEQAGARTRRAARATERERQRTFAAEVARQRQLIRQEQELARARRAAERAERGGLRRMAGAMGRGAMLAGGAALGAGRGALGAARSLQGAFGIRSQEEILGAAVDARQRFIVSAVQGGLRGPAIQAAIERSAAIGQRTGVSPEQIMGGIITAQERFSSLGSAVEGGPQATDEFFRNVEYMAEVARATGTEFDQVVGAAGSFARQFNLDAEQTREALAVLAEGALQGSLTFDDFSRRFPAAIANFIGARGISGMEGMREFQAVAQGLRAADVDPRVARTMQQDLFATLSNRRVAGRLRGLGIRALDERGNVRSMADIIEQSTGNDRAGVLGNLLQALGSREAANAFLMLRNQEILASQGAPGAMSLRERMSVDAEHGAELFGETLSALNADASGEVIRQRIDRESRLIASSDELIGAFSRLTGILTALEDENPLLTTVGAPVIEGAATGLGISALLSRLGGGAVAAGGTGGLLSSAAGSGGLLGAAGTGVGAAGAGMAALFAAAGLAIAGAVTAGISATGAFEDQRGRSLLEQLGDTFDDAGVAFGGGFMESVLNAFTGPADAGAEVERNQRMRGLSKDATVKIDSSSVRALGSAIAAQVREPGAGRREEGSPGR